MENEHDRTRPLTAQLRNSEGFILLLGMAMLILYVAVLIFCWLFLPHYYNVLAAVMVSNTALGRLAGLGVGFAGGLPFLPNVIANVYIESITVLLIYPLFILSWNKLLNFERLKRWSERLHATAERYKDKIKKYGVIGLFVFVFFPFWMTGPIVGAIIGYLMGLRHRVTLPVVIAGTFVATAAWAWLLEHIQRWAETFDERAPWLIVVAIAFLVLLGVLIRRLRARPDEPTSRR